MARPTRNAEQIMSELFSALLADTHRAVREQSAREIAQQFGLDAVDLDERVPFEPQRYRYFGMPRWWAQKRGAGFVWVDYLAVPASEAPDGPPDQVH